MYHQKYLGARVDKAVVYYIHDNGGRPFRIEIYEDMDPKIIKVYKKNDSEPILTYAPKKIFIGKSL
ncbi:MAG: hypothetical protein Harvfovirus3_18 [Harvfovirus sp.]|uniref:Uncharacterized protein n=1 Tax=Harvfovirus sp. TaxID=2487768 RepID=A0A3G5A426_9VIRU|nr:MAG: hypothetical protein Harvfovirus3_18 [Harvfovirus sp.]